MQNITNVCALEVDHTYTMKVATGSSFNITITEFSYSLIRYNWARIGDHGNGKSHVSVGLFQKWIDNETVIISSKFKPLEDDLFTI